jgi:hypothetical protein
MSENIVRALQYYYKTLSLKSNGIAVASRTTFETCVPFSPQKRFSVCKDASALRLLYGTFSNYALMHNLCALEITCYKMWSQVEMIYINTVFHSTYVIKH